MCLTKQSEIQLNQLHNELLRQRKDRLDILAHTDNITACVVDGALNLAVKNGTNLERYEVGPIAARQIATRLNIPWGYMERMISEYPHLAAANANVWLKKSGDTRLLRILDGKCRAYLSNKYRRLDNLEIFESILPALKNVKDLDVVKAQLTDTHMIIKICSKKMKANLTNVGDAVKAGFVASSSELGLGSVRLEHFLLRLVCSNGLITSSTDLASRKLHLGTENYAYGGYHIMSNSEPMSMNDTSYFDTVRKTIEQVADESSFNKSVDKLRALKDLPITATPMEAVEGLGEKFLVNKFEQALILSHFMKGQDYSAFGLLQAITRSAQDLPDYNRATDLERIGGRFLDYAHSFTTKENAVLELPKAA